MGIVIPPESQLGKELERWNTPKRFGGEAPDGHEEYPKMLYKAHRYSNGKVMCGHPRAAVGDNPEAMAFDQTCSMTVKNGEEHERYERLGWCESAQAAIEAFEKAERDVAAQAANAQHKVARMSEKAQREFDTAQDAAEFHDPDPAPPKLAPKPVVETAKQKRNRLAREKRAAAKTT